MIAVDTSAIMAILLVEDDAHRIRARLAATQAAFISTANLLELQIVIASERVSKGWDRAETVLAEYRIAARPFDERQLRIAREAAVTFGKGRHKAGLNFGDCFAYALAKSEALPLLCTGNDFIHTDLKLA